MLSLSVIDLLFLVAFVCNFVARYMDINKDINTLSYLLTYLLTYLRLRENSSSCRRETVDVIGQWLIMPLNSPGGSSVNLGTGRGFMCMYCGGLPCDPVSAQIVRVRRR